MHDNKASREVGLEKWGKLETYLVAEGGLLRPEILNMVVRD